MEDALKRLAKTIEMGRLKDRNKMERRGKRRIGHNRSRVLQPTGTQFRREPNLVDHSFRLQHDHRRSTIQSQLRSEPHRSFVDRKITQRNHADSLIQLAGNIARSGRESVKIRRLPTESRFASERILQQCELGQGTPVPRSKGRW